jgi:hypothetical protein
MFPPLPNVALSAYRWLSTSDDLALSLITLIAMPRVVAA